ncbi:hypothetical protein OpiT1DRAFT_04983 [Opitutaceae bacterium TAV1]|nr:hypothetical protein OpiT1DRAFT_04983 [Opitutaceae bacterium TAV1]
MSAAVIRPASPPETRVSETPEVTFRSCPFPLATWIVDLGLLTALALILASRPDGSQPWEHHLQLATGILAAYAFGRALHGQRTGWWAALIVASTPVAFGYPGIISQPTPRLLLAPWIVFLPQALFLLWRRLRALPPLRLPHESSSRFAWCLVVPLMAGSLFLVQERTASAGTLLATVATFACAPLIGNYLVHAWRVRQAPGLILGLLAFATVSLAALTGRIISNPPGHWLDTSVQIPGSLLIVALLCSSPRRGARRTALVIMLLMCFTFLPE